jgi:hypothetical protein
LQGLTTAESVGDRCCCWQAGKLFNKLTKMAAAKMNEGRADGLDAGEAMSLCGCKGGPAVTQTLSAQLLA